MSALIIGIFSRLRSKEKAKSPEDEAREGVSERLKGRGFPPTIVSQAKARAVRLVVAGVSPTVAIDRACKWALSAEHADPNLPPLPPAT